MVDGGPVSPWGTWDRRPANAENPRYVKLRCAFGTPLWPGHEARDARTASTSSPRPAIPSSDVGDRPGRARESPRARRVQRIGFVQRHDHDDLEQRGTG